jgi:hypothetical protein
MFDSGASMVAGKIGLCISIVDKATIAIVSTDPIEKATMKDDLDELMNWLNSSALMSDGFASLAILPLNAKVLLS